MMKLTIGFDFIIFYAMGCSYLTSQPKGVWNYQGFCDDCTQALVLKSVKGNVKKYQKLRDVIYGWFPTGKK